MSKGKATPVWGFDYETYGNGSYHAYDVYVGWNMWRSMDPARMKAVFSRMLKCPKYRPHQLRRIEILMEQLADA